MTAEGEAVPTPEGRSGFGARGAILLALALYCAWLGLGLPGSTRTGGPLVSSPRELTSPRALRTTLVRLGTAALLEVARFAPVGLLLAFAFGTRDRWLDRMSLAVLPACAATVSVVAAIRTWGAHAQPGTLTLVLPILGGLFGVWIGSAWQRGPRARLRLIPSLLVWAVLGVTLAAILAVLAVESHPLDIALANPSASDRRRVQALFRGMNPATIPEGETRTLRLTQRDLDVLLSSGLSLARNGPKARVEIGSEGLALLVSTRVSALRALGGYLNVAASGAMDARDGRLTLEPQFLALGRLEAPAWLLRLLKPLAEEALRTDPRLAPTLAAVRELRTSAGAMEVTYGRATLPPGFVNALFQEAGQGPAENEAVPVPDLLPAVKAQVKHLLDAAPLFPPGDPQLAAAVETSFALAKQRSGAASAATENRAALLALGILLGHSRLEILVGPVFESGERARATKAFRATTLRGRADWTHHFFVSGALTLLSTGVSDAAGLFKEEMDADGGSGFSFGDLLADRSGTTFATVATRDDASARAIQERLAGGFHVDDFFPPASGLPEGITEADLKARYGGVGGEKYKSLVADVERRIAACAAYR